MIDPVERRELGRQALRGGDAAQALRHLRRAVEVDRDDPVTWRLLGRCFEEIGEQRRAAMCHSVATRQILRIGGSLDDLEGGPLALDWDRMKAHEV